MQVDWKILWNCIKYKHWKMLWKMIKFEWRWRNYKSPFKLKKEAGFLSKKGGEK